MTERRESRFDGMPLAERLRDHASVVEFHGLHESVEDVARDGGWTRKDYEDELMLDLKEAADLVEDLDSETMRGVGFIAQVQQPDGVWLSWTQYTTMRGRSHTEAYELAATTVRRLLENEMYDFTAGRVVRADWVVVGEIEKGAAIDAGLEEGG